MPENISSIKERAVHTHSTIAKAKNTMCVMQIEYARLSYMIKNKIYNIYILSEITESMYILLERLKAYVDECNNLYTEISSNKNIQDYYGFDNEKIKEDSILFNDTASGFINNIEEVLKLTNEFIKVNSEEG